MADEQRRGGPGFLPFRTVRQRLLALLLAGAMPGAVVAALNAHTSYREAEHDLRHRPGAF